MESMSACKKTIAIQAPGFGDVVPNEVFICDMELKLPNPKRTTRRDCKNMWL